MKKRFRDLKKKSKNSQNNDKQSVVYATYVDRIKAFITDLFMIYTPILYIITYVILGTKEQFQESTIAHISGIVLYGVIYAIFLSKTGQTPGKKAYEIKVVDEQTKENISFFRALLRFFVFIFGATILVGLILPLYNKKKKALHDMVVRTIEIEFKN
jgi:uncharacterized RDD family membrane protein YckC